MKNKYKLKYEKSKNNKKLNIQTNYQKNIKIEIKINGLKKSQIQKLKNQISILYIYLTKMNYIFNNYMGCDVTTPYLGTYFQAQ